MTEQVDGTHTPSSGDLDSPSPPHKNEGRTFFGQPWPLKYVVNIEVWDQFSYYGLQAILLIYLLYSTTDGGLGIESSTAVGIVGAYAGLTYLSTALAAWVADRLLGSERTLFLSGCTVAAGHVALAVLPGLSGLIAGLALIAVGSGGVKSNTISVVGGIYETGDARRDAGFALYWSIIKIGGLAGPVLVGLVQVGFGFHAGFGLAAVGMFAGLIYYSRGRKYLPDSVRVVANPLPASQKLRLSLVAAALSGCVFSLFIFDVVTVENLASTVTIVSALLLVAVLSKVLVDKRLTAVERNNVLTLLPVIGILLIYSAGFVVQYAFLVTFADGRVDRGVGGMEFPVAWATALEALAVIAFTPLINRLWARLGNRQPTTVTKVSLGVGVMGVAAFGFLTMTQSVDGEAPLVGIVLVAALVGLSEALCLPNSLSLTTRLAPKAFASQMVSIVLLAAAVGSPLGAVLVGLYSRENETLFFLLCGGAFIAIGTAFALVAPRLSKRTGSVS